MPSDVDEEYVRREFDPNWDALRADLSLLLLSVLLLSEGESWRGRRCDLIVRRRSAEAAAIEDEEVEGAVVDETELFI